MEVPFENPLKLFEVEMEKDRTVWCGGPSEQLYHAAAFETGRFVAARSEQEPTVGGGFVTRKYPAHYCFTVLARTKEIAFRRANAMLSRMIADDLLEWSAEKGEARMLKLEGCDDD